MIGPEGTAENVRGWLAERIPARLRAIEARQELDPMPDPVGVHAQEHGPIAIEDWPVVYVLPQRLVTMTLAEVRDNATEVYRCTYAIRVLAWVRGDSYAGTDTLRKRYALAIREALLERKQITSGQHFGSATFGAGMYGEPAATTVTDPTSIREDYSDVMTDKSGRTIAGVIVDVNIIVGEVLDSTDPLAIVQRVAVATADTVSIPTHPGL